MYHRRHPRLYILLDNRDVRWFEEVDEEGYSLVKSQRIPRLFYLHQLEIGF